MPRMTHPCSASESPLDRQARAARSSTARATKRANRRRALPRWAKPAVKAALLLLPLGGILGLGAWGWSSGRLPAAMGAASASFLAGTAEAGLAVREILVSGRQQTDGDAILVALGVESGTPLLAFDPRLARERLEAIPWVASAIVERRLPDTIVVQLTERRPMAIWQHDKVLRLVDGDGHVLADRGLEQWPGLPLLVGAEAPKRARELLRLLADEPTIGQRVEAAVLVNGRRWDLKLDNGVDVRLPETDAAAALRQLATVQQTNRVLERDIVAIDLRVPDRLTVQTSAASADRRRAPQKKA